MKEPLASRVLFPVTERRFTYGAYDHWLDRLDGADVVLLADLERARSGDRPIVSLRHDIDSRLESALELGRLEHAHGFAATYFVLHTAPYYRDRPRVATVLRALQDDLGHEIGWHNDLGTLALIGHVDVAAVLKDELAWLRAEGIRVRGSAAHGSPHCLRLGYHNNYVFAGWDEPVPGYPQVELPAKLMPSDYGLEYEAYHLSYDRYFSDASFTNGRRWHPEALHVDALPAGERAVILVHPCHWDASAAAKWRRLASKIGGRVAAYNPHARSRVGSSVAAL